MKTSSLESTPGTSSPTSKSKIFLPHSFSLDNKQNIIDKFKKLGKSKNVEREKNVETQV